MVLTDSIVSFLDLRELNSILGLNENSRIRSLYNWLNFHSYILKLFMQHDSGCCRYFTHQTIDLSLQQTFILITAGKNAVETTDINDASLLLVSQLARYWSSTFIVVYLLRSVISVFFYKLLVLLRITDFHGMQI